MVYDYEFEFDPRQKKKIIMVPFPAQGHVTPMLKLASSLSTYGFEPLIILPEFIHRSIINNLSKGKNMSNITYMSIPDGLDETKHTDFFAIEMAMEDHMPAHLDRIIRKIDGVECMIVDILASWAINVGKERGISIVGFWPAMFATYSLVCSIPDMVQTGVISSSGLPQLKGNISYPDQPPLNIEDLPWLIGTQAGKVARFKFWARTMDRSKSLKCILVNSFPNEAQSKRASIPKCGPKIYPIGPLRSNGLFKSPTFWKEDVSCLDWLDQQKPNSVVYISFGSWVSPIGESNLKDLALSLEKLGRPFIWVIGPNWRDGLPYGYMERVGNFGKIVSWAPQVNVLQHNAVGCYLTHCGWNSTMEAIECKKTLLCFPVAGDQFLNCEFIVTVWRIGVKMSGFCFADVNDGINKVMGDWYMKKRIEDLNKKLMGEDAVSERKNDMLLFVSDIKKDQL